MGTPRPGICAQMRVAPCYKVEQAGGPCQCHGVCARVRFGELPVGFCRRCRRHHRPLSLVHEHRSRPSSQNVEEREGTVASSYSPLARVATCTSSCRTLQTQPRTQKRKSWRWCRRVELESGSLIWPCSRPFKPKIGSGALPWPWRSRLMVIKPEFPT